MKKNRICALLLLVCMLAQLCVPVFGVETIKPHIYMEERMLTSEDRTSLHIESAEEDIYGVFFSVNAGSDTGKELGAVMLTTVISFDSSVIQFYKTGTEQNQEEFCRPYDGYQALPLLYQEKDNRTLINSGCIAIDTVTATGKQGLYALLFKIKENDLRNLKPETFKIETEASNYGLVQADSAITYVDNQRNSYRYYSSQLDHANAMMDDMISVVKPPAQIATITVTPEGNPNLFIPVGTETQTVQYTAHVADQYGDEMPTEKVTWQLEPACTGITISETGVVTVTSSAKDEIGKDGVKTLQVIASCEEVQSNRQTVTVQRSSSVAAKVLICKGEIPIQEDIVRIPPASAKEPNRYSYTAKLLDQYGEPMEATPNWAVSPQDTVGVTISPDGTLEISNTAQANKITVTAGMENQTAAINITMETSTIEMDWSPVDNAFRQSGIVYGQTRAEAFDNLPAVGKAVADHKDLQGKFEVVNGAEKPVTGEDTVTVRFTVTESGSSYEGVTLDKDYSLTIQPAEITELDTTGIAAEKTILANNPANTDLTGLERFALPTQVKGFYAGGKSELFNITWTTDKTFKPTGETYLFTGTPVMTGNFAPTDKTVTVKLTVTPVKVTIGGMPKEIYLTKEQATAEDVSFSKIGLPEQVKLTYDNEQVTEPAVISAVYDQGIDALKAAGEKVTDKKEQTITVTLQVDAKDFPQWVTLPDKMPQTQITVANKTPIPDEDIVFESIKTWFGSEYNIAIQVTDEAKYPDLTIKYIYHDEAGQPIEQPKNAGTYTVTGLVENSKYRGMKTASLVIMPKPITDAGIMVAIPEGYKSIYNGTAQTPAVTVKDGDKTLKEGTDYTLEYVDNIKAGTAVIKVTGKGNYTGENKSRTFLIDPVSIADSTPVILGASKDHPAKVGDTLHVALSGLTGPEGDETWTPDSEIDWQWYTVTEGAEVEIVGATGSVFPLTEAESGISLVVKAKAKGNNYIGSAKTSATAVVEKMAFPGSVVLTESGGNRLMEAGDTLTATVTGLNPSPTNGFQWYRNDTAVEGATGNTYQVQVSDQTVKVVYTPDPARYTGTVETSVKVGKTLLIGTVKLEREGEIVTATVDGATDGTYDLVWLRDDGTELARNEQNYSIVTADKGHSIFVKLYAKEEYTGEILSNVVPISAEVPDTPTNVQAQPADQKVTLSWAAPAGNGAVVEGYTVICKTGKGIVKEERTTGTNYTVTGLTNDTEYAFTVTAQNRMGHSTPSTSVTAKPQGSGGSGGGGGSSGGGSGGGGGGSGGGGGGGAPAPTPIPVPLPTPTPTAPVTPTPTQTLTPVLSVMPEGKGDNGSYTATISDEDAKRIVEAAKVDQGGSIVIAPQIKEDAKEVSVYVPVSAVSGAAESTLKNVIVQTPIAEIVLPDAALEDLSKAANQTVGVAARKQEDGVIGVAITADDKKLDTVSGGFTLRVPVEEASGKGIVAVLMGEDGEESVIRSSIIVDGQLIVPLNGSGRIRIMDNRKNFEDVPQDVNYWARDSVDFVTSHELFQGTGEKTFSPDGNMTRGMLVTVLYRLQGEKKVEIPASFHDVERDIWYADAVQWAAGVGVVKGIGENIFAPEIEISRETLCTMLYRYAQMAGWNTAARDSLDRFADAGGVSDWAANEVRWAVGIGLLNGKGDGTLDPTGPATRAQVAAILMRFVEFSVKGN